MSFDGALCTEVGGDLWFPDDYAGAQPNQGAKALCQDCPAREACLQYALDHQIHDGVWGGLSYRERLAVA